MPIQLVRLLLPRGNSAMQENDAAAHMAGSRYPRRNRNVVSRPESAQGSGHAASSSKDQDDDQSGSEQVHAQLLHYSCMHAGCIYQCCLAVSLQASDV